jgi:hypothetical protein
MFNQWSLLLLYSANSKACLPDVCGNLFSFVDTPRNESDVTESIWNPWSRRLANSRTAAVWGSRPMKEPRATQWHRLRQRYCAAVDSRWRQSVSVGQCLQISTRRQVKIAPWTGRTAYLEVPHAGELQFTEDSSRSVQRRRMLLRSFGVRPQQVIDHEV